LIYSMPFYQVCSSSVYLARSDIYHHPHYSSPS
jgi:hypothetical protein